MPKKDISFNKFFFRGFIYIIFCKLIVTFSILIPYNLLYIICYFLSPIFERGVFFIKIKESLLLCCRWVICIGLSYHTFKKNMRTIHSAYGEFLHFIPTWIIVLIFVDILSFLHGVTKWRALLIGFMFTWRLHCRKNFICFFEF